MNIKRLIFLFLFAGVCTFYSHAQESHALERNIERLPDDTIKVLMIRKLVDSLREFSSPKALYFALEGKAISEKIGYKRGLIYMLESISWMHYRNKELSKAMQSAKDALAIAKDLGDESAIAKCMINIAAIKFDEKKYDVAIIHFKEAARLSKNAGDDLTYARSMGNAGFCFIQLHQFDSATFYSKASYAMGDKHKDAYIKGFSLRNLGEIASLQQNFANAIERFNEGIAIADEAKNQYLKISILYRLGAVYNQLKKPRIAIRILNEAISIGKENNHRDELEKALKLITESYLQLNDYKNAFDSQHQYILLHDSLTNQKKEEQMILAQTKFDSKMKESQIELLTREAAIQKKAYQRQQTLTYFLIGCATLLLLTLGVLWYNNRKINEVNRLVEFRNKKIKEQSELLRVSNATKDKLFSIVSHDLRSPLGGLKGLMELISRGGLTQEQFVAVSQNLRRNIDSVYDDLDNLLQWAHSQLNGMVLKKERLSLEAMVAEKVHLFEEVARVKNVALILNVEDNLHLFVDKNQMGLVLRNLIANAVKFSNYNGTVEIKARRRGDAILITVKDTGVGMSRTELNKLFNVDTHFSKHGTQNEKGIGLGLILVKEFVEKNGGSISVESEEGKGSSFTITLENQPVEVLQMSLAL